MTRGSLIWPMAVEIARIDTVTTRAASGYDDKLAEPKILDVADEDPGIPPMGAPRGARATQYLPPIILEAQIEDFNSNALIAALTGKNSDVKLACVFHYADLEADGLVDADGHPQLRVGDRLLRILDPDTYDQIVVIPDPPGLYATAVDDQSFGLSSLERNLLHVTFQRRDRSSPQ